MTTTLGRRAFVRGGAAGAVLAGTASVAGCTDRRPSPAGPPSRAPASGPDRPARNGPAALQDWDAVRSLFPLDPRLSHLAAFVLAAHPEPVRAAIDRWRRRLDEDTVRVLAEEQAHEQTVREAAAGYLGAAPDEVALTDSTTMGLGIVYNGLRLRRGDRVLTTTHDFYSTHESLRLAAVRSGATLDRIDLYDDPSTAGAEEMTARLDRALRPSTRVVALTWVHSGTGVKIPVAAMAAVLADANRGRRPEDRAILCLDAIHGLGACPEDIATLGADVFVSGTHKWLFGPRGTGLVWARNGAAESALPTIPSFYAPSFGNWLTGGSVPSPFGLGMTPGGYHSFEHRWAVVEAFELHSVLGRRRVGDRTTELASRLKEGLSDVPGVRLVTPVDPATSAGLVCCEVAGLQPYDATVALRQRHAIVASVTPYATPYLRFGPSIVNSPEQVDGAVEALAALSRGR